MTCQYGTKPRESAPDRVYLDSGVFCSVLGLTHPLCRIPDRIYFEALSALGGVTGLLNRPPKVVDWARKFGRGIWAASWEDAAQNGLRPDVFCNSPRPPEPDEITYLDLVGFLLGESDLILQKIFDWWKFTIWGDHCQCKDSPLVASLLPVSVGPVSWPAPPPVPVCGGTSIVTTAAIQNAFQPLVDQAQEYFDYKTAQLGEQAQVIAQLQAAPQTIRDNSSPIIFDTQYSGTVRTVSPYFLEETFPLPTGPLRRTTLIPATQTATASWPGVTIQAIWWPRTTERTQAYEWRQFALTDLIPPPGSSAAPISAGTTLSWGNMVAGTGNLVISWYFRISLQGGGCPQGGSSGWSSWTQGTDPDTDDAKICRDVARLCKVVHPACQCHERPQFSITLQDIENLLGILPPISP